MTRSALRTLIVLAAAVSTASMVLPLAARRSAVARRLGAERDKPWWQNHSLTIPHPNSLEHSEILANIRAIVRQTKFGLTSAIGALRRRDAVRVRRVLKARSEIGPPVYLVVELDGPEKALAGVFVMTPDGLPILLSDPPACPIARPLDLSDASARVEARLGRPLVSAEYLYFHNTLERGISLDRPLAVITTDRGLIYLNSDGGAFVEAQSELAKSLGASDQPVSSISGRSLVPVECWRAR